MAKEHVQGDGGRLVKVQISEWRLWAEEEALIRHARDLPNWRLADKARRMAADYSAHFSGQMPPVVDRELSEIDASTASRWAVISASGNAVRSASAAMMLIASGYLPESGGPARPMIEAFIRSSSSYRELADAACASAPGGEELQPTRPTPRQQNEG